MAEGEANRVGVTALLALVLATALGLRLTGLDRMLPHMPEPDAYVVEQAHMLEGGLDRAERSSRTWGKYPHLLAHLLRLWPAPEEVDAPLDEETRQQHLARASAPLVGGRQLSALLSFLAVGLTFLLGRRFLGPWGGLLAAALLSTSLLHLDYSQQARPHAPLTTAVLFSVLCSLQLVRRGATPAVGLAVGIAAALAVATLHSGVAVLLPLGVAYFLRGGERRRRDWLGLIPTVALLAGAIALFYPFLFQPAGESEALATEAGVLQSGHEIQLSWLDGGGFRVIWQTFLDCDPLLLAGSVLGVLLFGLRALRGAGPEGAERRRELYVCLAFVLPYLVVVGIFRKSFDRFLLPTYPFLCCCAAFGVIELARVLGGRKRAVAAVALGLGALAFPAWVALSFVRLHLAADTPTQALAWLERHADRESEVLLESRLCLPALFQPRITRGERGQELMHKIPWEEYLLAAAPPPPIDELWQFTPIWSRADLRALPTDPVRGSPPPNTAPSLLRLLSELGGDWAVVISADLGRHARPLEQALEKLGQPEVLIRAFDSAQGGSRFPGYGRESLWRRALGGRCWGPDIEIWRMNEP